MSKTTAEALLEQFKQEMLAKLEIRAAKYPDDNFVSMGMEQMMTYPLQPILTHMNDEIEELYGARGFSDDSATMEEDVDVANMAFIEWALRWARHKELSKIEPAKHFHTINCPLDPETHLCPIGYDGKRK